MDINFDIWTGESIQDIIQIIAEFRFQLFGESQKVQPNLSQEINFLQHYFDSEACIIVANEGGSFVGYIALVGYSEYHQNLSEYGHYGDDLNVTEGPMVLPDYRNMGIVKGLIQEALNACEIKGIALLFIDPSQILSESDEMVVKKITKNYNFKNESNGMYKREFYP